MGNYERQLKQWLQKGTEYDKEVEAEISRIERTLEGHQKQTNRDPLSVNRDTPFGSEARVRELSKNGLKDLENGLKDLENRLKDYLTNFQGRFEKVSQQVNNLKSVQDAEVVKVSSVVSQGLPKVEETLRQLQEWVQTLQNAIDDLKAVSSSQGQVPQVQELLDQIGDLQTRLDNEEKKSGQLVEEMGGIREQVEKEVETKVKEAVEKLRTESREEIERSKAEAKDEIEKIRAEFLEKLQFLSTPAGSSVYTPAVAEPQDEIITQVASDSSQSSDDALHRNDHDDQQQPLPEDDSQPSYPQPEWIRYYNYSPEKLPEYTAVCIPESVIGEQRIGRSQQTLFEANTGGDDDYWIVLNPGYDYAYLVPKRKFNFNRHTTEVAEACFEFDQDEQTDFLKFDLIVPAIVKLNGSRWILEQKGRLEFKRKSLLSTNLSNGDP